MATELTMPRLSDSMEEGTILKWLVAEGDAVQEGTPIVEVETDKATVVHEALSAGVVLALTVAEGASVPVGAPILIVGEAGESLPRSAAPDATAAATALADGSQAPITPVGAGGGPVSAAAATGADPAAARAAGSRGARVAGAPTNGASGSVTAAPANGTAGARTKASPLARRLAAGAGLDLGGLAGSGPQGRIIRSDVERALSTTANGHAGATAAPSPREEGGAKGTTQVEELTRIQQTVARRMAESRATVPDIELRVEVDMSAAVALREELRPVNDPLPSFNDLVVKACAVALREFPRVNGAYRDGHFELFSRINVGIAVAAPDALLVPTVTDADERSLGAIARESRRLAGRVRDGSISPAELSGATFTVSNLGMFGVDSFSAVINEPQAAILTVGSLRPRAIVDADGGLVARPTVVLSLSCDHRILYGADGARFLARVRELLERPVAMLAA